MEKKVYEPTDTNQEHYKRFDSWHNKIKDSMELMRQACDVIDDQQRLIHKVLLRLYVFLGNLHYVYMRCGLTPRHRF